MLGLKFIGRPPIKIADSIREIVRGVNEYSRVILDRTQLVTEEFISAILGQSVMSWEGRHPAPALDENGNFQGTDLDLLSFMVPLADRGAVIEIPRYEIRRQKVVRASERKIGQNQFGQVTGLISNKRVYSFSVRIWDQTIAVTGEDERERLGADRNYMLVDITGTWYEGWDKIVFKPLAKENDFIRDFRLAVDNTVYFKYYVHPNRWQSVFSSQHLLKKMLIARMEDEAAFCGTEMERLENMGFQLPAGTKKPYEKPETTGETAPITVQTMDFEVDMPPFRGNYRPYADGVSGLTEAYHRRRVLLFVLRPMVQFCTRANEAAYFKFGNGRVAGWLEGRTWKSGIRLPKGRTEWNQMVLGPDYAFRYRLKEITERVAAAT